MRAMVLAAGEGKRLQPLTYDFPKPLVPVANRPVMEHILLWLARHDIREVVINTHYLAEQIEDYFGDGSRYGMDIYFSREDKLWGTAGSVARVKSYFKDTFLVIGGDDLSDVDLTQLVEQHKESGALASIGLKEVEDTSQFGVVVADDNGAIFRFQEKPKPEEALSNFANTGIYLFEPDIFRYMPEGEVYDFGHQLFPLLLEKREKFFGFPVEGFWCDVGSLKEYKESHWAILDGECKIEIPGRQISPGVWVEDGARIHPDSKVFAPCIIGSGAMIEPGAKLAGHVVVGRNARVSKGAALDHAIVWDNAVVKENITLRDAVICVDRVTT